MKLSRLKFKKAIVFTGLLLAVLFCVLALSACGEPDLTQEVVRIHIRANSNSPIDQAVKLKVRDSVTEYLTERLEGVNSKAQALETLDASKAEITKIANEVLAQNGFDYKANIYIGKETFPERVYGEYTFPEGEYDSLILNLGTGEGDNWWCVAFPPLCFVPEGEVVYKSWVKEKLDSLFG